MFLLIVRNVVRLSKFLTKFFNAHITLTISLEIRRMAKFIMTCGQQILAAGKFLMPALDSTTRRPGIYLRATSTCKLRCMSVQAALDRNWKLEIRGFCKLESCPVFMSGRFSCRWMRKALNACGKGILSLPEYVTFRMMFYSVIHRVWLNKWAEDESVEMKRFQLHERIVGL